MESEPRAIDAKFKVVDPGPPPGFTPQQWSEWKAKPWWRRPYRLEINWWVVLGGLALGLASAARHLTGP